MAIEQLDNTPRCLHVRLSGRRCKAPARRGGNYCLFHEAEHPTTIDLTFPPVEDAASVAIATAQVIDAIKCDMIDFRRAALLFAGLRIARANLKQLGVELSDSIEQPAAVKDDEDDAPSFAEILLERLNVLEAEDAKKQGLPAPPPIDIKQALASGKDLGQLLLEHLEVIEDPAEQEAATGDTGTQTEETKVAPAC
jgi:hypothetical protein